MNLLILKGLITCDAVTEPDIQFPALPYDHIRGLVEVYREVGVNLGISCSGIKFCNSHKVHSCVQPDSSLHGASVNILKYYIDKFNSN